MKCSKCGAELSEGEKFCAACGTKVEAAKFCAACGAKLKAGAAFCTECGAKAGEEQASPAQEQKEQSAPPPVPPQSAPATTAAKAADNSSKWLTIKDGCVTECDKSAKGHIVIPDGVTRIWGHGSKIWDEMWDDDDEWETVDSYFDDGEKFGGFGAFEGCTLITSITIPDSVTTIGPHAFKGCTSLTSITINGIPEIDDKFTFYGPLRISADTFGGYTSLESVEFGGTMAEWEKVHWESKYVFLNDIPVKSVKCADGEWKRPSILVEKGRVEVCLDKTVTSIVIPDGVTEIRGNCYISHHGGAFEGCTSLASVTIPKGITEIEEGAFEGCTSLESVEFGGTMAEWEKVNGKYFLNDIPAKSVKCADGEWKLSILVEDGEVVGCFDKTVTSIVIPDGVTKIWGSAFYGCTSLASVTIPGSVTEIGSDVFEGCDSLHEIHVRGTPSKELKKKFGLFGEYKKIKLVKE